jgi:phosphoglycerate dehydrogenase-like enzyme
LADQADLIVQVVPVTLLEFTKTIFQERFSAILKKGVMTFSFSRYQTVTPQLLSSFLQAKENKSVCLSTPTDLKSIFLKVLQNCA